MHKKNLSLLITLLFVLSACSPAAPTQEAMKEKSPTVVMMEKTSDNTMKTPTKVVDATATKAISGEKTNVPAFFDISLTNVNTGKSFKISDFAGKVVLVENLAMWCPNCKKQQEELKILEKALGVNSDLIMIGFDVDPNEKAADLKKYTESNGFNWVYAVPPPEVLNEISKLYGANFLNPPSTPIFIIDRKGGVHPMPFGFKSSGDLKKFIDPLLAEGK